MDALIFALGAVLPIMLTVCIGYFIKRIGLIGQAFAVTANKLVFKIFLPTMLFLNVYKISSIGNIELGAIGYGAVVILFVFAVSIPLVMAVTRKNERRGPLLQATFRSNYALIGIPLVESLFGQSALAGASLMSAMSIPLFNALAVIALTVFGKGGGKPSVKKIILGIVKNPLIQAVFFGICALAVREIFVYFGIGFRLSDIKPLYTVLGYLSNIATPLALLVLGIQFDFGVIKDLKKEIIFGTLMRTAAVPLFGLGVAYAFFKESFDGAQFASLVALFATPVAVSTVPMAQEMDADASLAGQLVVWSTLLSALSIFVASFIFRSAGIF